MTRAAIAGGLCAAALILLAVAVGYRALDRDVLPAAATSPALAPALAPATVGAATQRSQGFLYGRITAVDGAAYEGRLRLGGGEEAFWGDYFNGMKRENPWVVHVPPERMRRERPIEIFGIKIATRESAIDTRRQLMARFGEISRIEARGRLVRVTLESGTAVDLDRFEASDFDDGVRVWDDRRGVVDIDSLRVRAIEFLPTPSLGDVPGRLHATVRTRQGDFTGFVEWNRKGRVGADELDGRAADGEFRLRFDTIRAISRRSRDVALATLFDGREIALTGRADVGGGNRGIEVEDRRYGRVQISWDAFERAEFSDPGPAGSGLARGDFPPGRPLSGSVSAVGGHRVAGRLVYDLDESETTDTLDAQDQGLHYTIPFGSIASIDLSGTAERDARRAKVTLKSGEELLLERSGDLGDGNAGILIFVDGVERPEYLPWTEVGRIDFDPPPATLVPRLGDRV